MKDQADSATGEVTNETRVGGLLNWIDWLWRVSVARMKHSIVGCPEKSLSWTEWRVEIGILASGARRVRHRLCSECEGFAAREEKP